MPRPFKEWLRIHLLAAELRRHDDDLAEAYLAICEDAEDRDAWRRLYDRMCACGRFESADKIQEVHADLFDT